MMSLTPATTGVAAKEGDGLRIYYVRGIEREAGVETADPIEARNEEEAARIARERGIEPKSVELMDAENSPAERPAAPSRSGAPTGIPPHEVTEKTGRGVRSRYLLGWISILFIAPALVFILGFLGRVMGLNPWVAGSVSVVVAAIVVVFGITRILPRSR